MNEPHDADDGDEIALPPDEGDFTRGELIDFLGDFLSQHKDADTLYRDHLCAVLVGRVFDEFGPEGLCGLMMQIDLRAGWITDIIFESSDFENALFKRHGAFLDDVTMRARSTEALLELNRKIWRLRRKYSNIIADEIVASLNKVGEKEE